MGSERSTSRLKETRYIVQNSERMARAIRPLKVIETAIAISYYSAYNNLRHVFYRFRDILCDEYTRNRRLYPLPSHLRVSLDSMELPCEIGVEN